MNVDSCIYAEADANDFALVQHACVQQRDGGQESLRELSGMQLQLRDSMGFYHDSRVFYALQELYRQNLLVCRAEHDAPQLMQVVRKESTYEEQHGMQLKPKPTGGPSKAFGSIETPNNTSQSLHNQIYALSHGLIVQYLLCEDTLLLPYACPSTCRCSMLLPICEDPDTALRKGLSAWKPSGKKHVPMGGLIASGTGAFSLSTAFVPGMVGDAGKGKIPLPWLMPLKKLDLQGMLGIDGAELFDPNAVLGVNDTYISDAFQLIHAYLQKSNEFEIANSKNCTSSSINALFHGFLGTVFTQRTDQSAWVTPLVPFIHLCTAMQECTTTKDEEQVASKNSPNDSESEIDTVDYISLQNRQYYKQHQGLYREFFLSLIQMLLQFEGTAQGKHILAVYIHAQSQFIQTLVSLDPELLYVITGMVCKSIFDAASLKQQILTLLLKQIFQQYEQCSVKIPGVLFAAYMSFQDAHAATTEAALELFQSTVIVDIFVKQAPPEFMPYFLDRATQAQTSWTPTVKNHYANVCLIFYEHNIYAEQCSALQTTLQTNVLDIRDVWTRLGDTQCVMQARQPPLKYSNLVLEASIGSGSQGTVWTCYVAERLRSRSQWRQSVAKIVDTLAVAESQQARFALQRELSVLHLFPSISLCSHQTATIAPNSIVLLLEKASGSILSILNSGIDVHSRTALTLGVLLGLLTLHAHGIAHGDVKPDNILIFRNNHVKLTDFGSCCKMLVDTPIDTSPVYLAKTLELHQPLEEHTSRDTETVCPVESQEHTLQSVNTAVLGNTQECIDSLRKCEILGTFAYYSPELAWKYQHQQPVRSTAPGDQWALGCILFIASSRKMHVSKNTKIKTQLTSSSLHRRSMKLPQQVDQEENSVNLTGVDLVPQSIVNMSKDVMKYIYAIHYPMNHCTVEDTVLQEVQQWQPHRVRGVIGESELAFIQQLLHPLPWLRLGVVPVTIETTTIPTDVFCIEYTTYVREYLSKHENSTTARTAMKVGCGTGSEIAGYYRIDYNIILTHPYLLSFLQSTGKTMSETASIPYGKLHTALQDLPVVQQNHIQQFLATKGQVQITPNKTGINWVRRLHSTILSPLPVPTTLDTTFEPVLLSTLQIQKTLESSVLNDMMQNIQHQQYTQEVSSLLKPSTSMQIHNKPMRTQTPKPRMGL